MVLRDFGSPRFIFSACLVLVSLCTVALADAKDTEVDADFYVAKIKPLIHEKCISCHGALKQESQLRLDTAASIRKGSENGSIVSASDSKNASDSIALIARLRSHGSDRMPPEGEGTPFKKEEIDWLQAWIANGLPAPEDEVALSGPKEHWAFRPIPKLTEPLQLDNLLAKHHTSLGIVPLPESDRLTLLRRVTFDLTGLPPTPEELSSFLSDSDPQAYEKRVDQLMERFAYSERWGRHWMDVWRYSDWDGYKDELRGSQRNIWHWRDWIMESLQQNKPYDRMILEMLAGDEIAPTDAATLRATGFLARNFHKSNRNIWLDSTIEHTSKAFLGLTLNCSKCHDHKYDPIPQVDYYRFRALFEPHQVRTDEVVVAPFDRPGIPRAYDAEIEAATFLFRRGDDKLVDKDTAISPNIPQGLPFEIPLNVDSIPLPFDSYAPGITPAAKQRSREKQWKSLEEANQAIQKWFTENATGRGDEAKNLSIHPALSMAILRLHEREASLASWDARWSADEAKCNNRDTKEIESLSQVAIEREKAWKSLELELRVAQAEVALRSAESEAGKDTKKKPNLDKLRKDIETVKQTLHKWNDQGKREFKNYTPIAPIYPKQSTGRRTALAKWMIDPRNPLTARVAVNHVWARHFGTPLVENVFDFGMKTPKPELLDVLDSLAADFQMHGWDLKRLHRQLVTSQSYRRASTGDASTLQDNTLRDRDNRTYWRSNVRRLDAEEVRDAVMAASGMLDRSTGGPDLDEDKGDTLYRRSVYFRHAYEKQMTMLVLFDAASPAECYRRRPSIIPQQALVLANSPLTRHASQKLGVKLWAESMHDQDAFIQRLFLTTLGRPASSEETNASKEFLAQHIDRSRKASNSSSEVDAPYWEKACQSLAHVLMNHNDFVSVR